LKGRRSFLLPLCRLSFTKTGSLDSRAYHEFTGPRTICSPGGPDPDPTHPVSMRFACGQHANPHTHNHLRRQLAQLRKYPKLRKSFRILVWFAVPLRPRGRPLSIMRLSVGYRPRSTSSGVFGGESLPPTASHGVGSINYAHPQLSCTTRAVTRRELVSVGSTGHARGRSSACVSSFYRVFLR
jgi:hypothetical protein